LLLVADILLLASREEAVPGQHGRKPLLLKGCIWETCFGMLGDSMNQYCHSIQGEAPKGSCNQLLRKLE
jgi:hypothetical protein